MQVTTRKKLSAPVVHGGEASVRAASVIGDAWSWLILREAVLHRTTRFAEFHARVGAPRSTLSARLAALTASGMLIHEGTDYLPADAAIDFLGCLLVAMRWGDQWEFEGAAPQPIVHTPCGNRLQAVMACNNCHARVRAADVAATRIDVGHAPHLPGGSKRRPAYEVMQRARPCAIASALAVSGDWWAGLLIRECFIGTRRFDDFQRRLGVAPNILSSRLRRLIELDILKRTIHDEWPVRHEYRLTEKGLDYYHVLLAQLMWGQRWLGRTDFDPTLTHSPCQATSGFNATCAACGKVVKRDDIALVD